MSGMIMLASTRLIILKTYPLISVMLPLLTYSDKCTAPFLDVVDVIFFKHNCQNIANN